MTKEEIGKIIKMYRLQSNLTQEQVAQAIGRTQQVIGSWENGKAQPDANTLFELCDLFNVSIDVAFGKGRQFKITAPELAHIQKYRILDAHGKEVVDIVLDKEHERCTTAVEPRATRLISMPVYNDPAAAGIPLYAESEFERMDFDESHVPADADFGVRISGTSMEPTIHDSQIVWVKKADSINTNHIGIFMLSGGEAVCKRAKANENGRIIELLSDNPAYAPINGSTLEDLRIVGEVLLDK